MHPDSNTAMQAKAEYGEPERDKAETPRAIEAADSRLGEAHDRLSMLERRLAPILLRFDESPSVDPSIAVVAPTRSEVSEQIWSIESQAARLITRLADLTGRVDL